MLTSEVLNTAADLIEKRGWIKGEGWPGIDESAPLCLEGALAAAVGIRNYFELLNEEVDAFEACPAFRAVQSYVGRGDLRYLYPWNDEQDSVEPVIEVLRACALIESAREQDSAWKTYATNVARVTA